MKPASSFAALALMLAAPAAAEVVAVGVPVAAPAARPQLSVTERAGYRVAFQAIRTGDFDAASAALDMLADGALTPVARSELWLADATRRDPAAISTLIAANPDMPEVPALQRFADRFVSIPVQQPLVRLAGPSKRVVTRATLPGSLFATQVQPLLKAGDALAAEPIIEAAAETLPPEALTEWRQKLAWTYFQSGDDLSARRVATLAQIGAGDWAVDAAWINGLAAWRAGDRAAAANAFDRVAANAGDDETRAAGLFWAARSAVASPNDPRTPEARLKAAARLDETFYGMLASAALGLPMAPAGLIDGSNSDVLIRHPNIRAAQALVEIGETALADRLLRYQARIGSPAEHAGLIAVAARLGLPATQIWLAQNAPRGTRTNIAARFPLPAWSPLQGWRVDPALIYAHALQESEFRTDAVSRSGARGLMQLMPATAQLIARHKGDAMRQLDDPAVSFEYGQSYLEELASSGSTAGLLPKVIAAYNAGPNNVARWTNGSDDPLLFIESIPFSQTRAYVAIVLRNYWIYQREGGTATPSLTAMAQGRWPLFPARKVQTASTGVATYAPN